MVAPVMSTTGPASTSASKAAVWGIEPQRAGTPLAPCRARGCASPTKAAMMQPAARSAARSGYQLAGRQLGVRCRRRRATGPTSTGRNQSAWPSRPSAIGIRIDGFGLFTGRVGYAFEQRPALRQGRCRASCPNATATTNRATGATGHRSRRHPLGLAPSASAANTASPRTGRSASNTTTSIHRIERNFTSASPAPSPFDAYPPQDVDHGHRVGVNYRFGGPVVAKY